MSAQDLAKLAALLADETRAGFCLALLDGRAWTATELGNAAGVARSTASEHLSKLVEGGLLAEERQGRHRYLRLADPGTAELIELMMTRLAPAPTKTLKAATTNKAMAAARTCYDHLAGTLGVGIADAMRDRRLLDTNLSVTDEGKSWFADLDVELRSRTRPVARACLDWTERRPHLAGAAGAALCATLMARRWVVRVGTSRAVRLTDAGGDALFGLLGVRLAPQ